MIFGIILLAIAAILLVWFVAWFIITRVNGNCPLCAMEKIAHPSKLTIDTTDAPNYGGATVPPMGWSSAGMASRSAAKKCRQRRPEWR